MPARWIRSVPAADGPAELTELRVRSIYAHVLEGTRSGVRRLTLARIDDELHRRPRGLHVVDLDALRADARRFGLGHHPDDDGLPPHELRACVRAAGPGGRYELEILAFLSLDAEPFSALDRALADVRVRDLGVLVPYDD